MRGPTLLVGLLLGCIALALRFSPVHATEETLTVYVSPDGDDSADGSSPEPGPRYGTGPVRTLERAKLLLRHLRARERDAKRGYSVVLRGGYYELDRSLTFGPEDSGLPGAPIIYRSYPGELARISGGRRVRGWERLGDGSWSVSYRDPLSPDGCPSQLFVGGERRGRPRLPAAGTFEIFRVPGEVGGGARRNDRFYAHQSDLPDRISVGVDTEVVVFAAWSASRMRLRSYDPASGLLRLSGKFVRNGRDMTAGLPYYIENFRGGPIAEKTWQCDARAGEIRYRPGRDESFETSDLVAPHLGTLVILQGRGGESVHDIRFEDLYFETSSWHLPPMGWAAMQAEVGLPAAIEMRDAHRISFSRFALVRTGANGIGIRENCFDISVTGGELRDLGGTGIAIGSDQRRPIQGTAWSSGETSLARTHHVMVRDNLIASVGRIHWAAVGIWVGQADHVAIERNEIRDLYYSGISVGWTWGYGESLSHDNRVVGNIIRRYGQGLLSDLGGVYTLGRQTNSVVSDNVILHGKARSYGGHGLYADEGTAGFAFRNNVVYDVSHAGIHDHYGTDLIFDGNTLLHYREAGIRCPKKSRRASVVFKNNHLQSYGVPPLLGNCAGPSYVFENNLLRDSSGPMLLLGKTASEATVSTRPLSPADRTWPRSSGGGPRANFALRDVREAISEASHRAGRLSETRLTREMRDGPSALP